MRSHGCTLQLDRKPAGSLQELFRFGNGLGFRGFFDGPDTREEAASKDIVLVAVNWSKLPVALAGLPDFGSRIVVDANNPIEAPLFKPAELNGRLSSEVFAGMVPGARVVKVFNHLQPHLLSGDPRAEGGRRVLFYSGDDAQSKAEVGTLIDRLGFFGIDLGPLAIGGKLVQFPGGRLPALNLVKLG